MMSELSKSTDVDVQGDMFCLQSMFPNYAGLPEEDHLSIYKATSDNYTMYMHEVMKESDAIEFRKAMHK